MFTGDPNICRQAEEDEEARRKPRKDETRE